MKCCIVSQKCCTYIFLSGVHTFQVEQILLNYQTISCTVKKLKVSQLTPLSPTSCFSNFNVKLNFSFNYYCSVEEKQ